MFAVGLVTCAQFTSPLLLGPWAGVLTHRLGNWRALLITQIASAGVAAGLAALQFSGDLDEGRQAAVMALWAVAWAGSKPIASLIDGSLPGLIGVRFTGILVALPAAVPALVLITNWRPSCFQRGR